MSDVTHDPEPSASTAPAMSKNQQKKLLRRERLAALKPERRRKEKEARKERNLKRKLDAANGQAQTTQKKRKVQQTLSTCTILIELAWDDKMTERESISMVQQINQAYGCWRGAAVKPRLLLSSFGDRVKRKMDHDGEQYKRWKQVDFEERSLDQLIEEGKWEKDQLVYLTADSDTVLETLEEETCYIIGGIVDKNRHKNLCLDRATNLGIKSAQLPIGQFVKDMPSRKVLTTNHVVHILLLYLEHKDWEKAFYEVIPRRKFHQTGDSLEIEEDDSKIDEESIERPKQTDEAGRGSGKDVK